MTKQALNFIVIFIALLLAQAIIFNNLVLFNMAVPFVFIYIIITLPVTINTNLALTIGFFTGLTIDIFSDTYGLNALACTILAFIHRPVFHLYVPRDEDLASQRPTMHALGSATFMKYALTMTLIYCLTYFSIEAFGQVDFPRILLRVLTSTLYSFIFIYAIDSFSIKQHQRREKKL